MNNRTIAESYLQDLYIGAAVEMLRSEGEWGTNTVDPYALWGVLTAQFPPGLEPEDFDTFVDRGLDQINSFFEAALERLRG